MKGCGWTWVCGLVAAACLLAGDAAASGFTIGGELDGSGSVRLTYRGSNRWRPVVVAVVLDTPGTCTVKVMRDTGELEYPVSLVSGEGQSFVYVVEGLYWFSRTQALRVTVVPAAPGKVEVICE